ncbi:hypothetical protein J4G37_63180, partial [Microvirga sp. 3-52]|nr:hypothetical protein [Microvirga sp. 3-52]
LRTQQPPQNSIFPHILSPHAIPAILNLTIQKEVDSYQNNAKKRTAIIKGNPKINRATPKRFTAS